MREISVEGLELIGRGGMSSIYKLNDEQAVKVYAADTTLEEVERNKNISDELAAAGIPVAVYFEIVRAGECYGIIMELIGSYTVAKAVRKDPSSEETYSRKMAELLKKIHSAELPGGRLPAMKDMLFEWIEIMERKYHMSKRTGRCMRQLTGTLSDTGRVLHLDFHEGNVMLRGDELVLVDIDEMCTGEPAFDFAGMFINHILAAGTPGLLERAVGLDAKTTGRMFRQIIRAYCDQDGRRYKQAVRLTHMLSMLMVGLAPARFGEISEISPLNMWFIKNVAQPVFCMMWRRYRSNAAGMFADVCPEAAGQRVVGQ